MAVWRRLLPVLPQARAGGAGPRTHDPGRRSEVAAHRPPAARSWSPQPGGHRPRWPGLFVVGDATFNSLAVGSILVVAVARSRLVTVPPALLVAQPAAGPTARECRFCGASARRLPARTPVGSAAACCPWCAAPARRAAALRPGRPRPGRTRPRHADPLRHLGHAAHVHPEVQTVKAISASFPADEGASATVVVKAAPAHRGGSCRPSSGSAARRPRPAPSSPRGRRETSADGSTSLVVLGMPYGETDGPRPGGRPAQAGRCACRRHPPEGGEHAVGGRGRRRRLRPPAAGSPRPGVGFVLLLTMLMWPSPSSLVP